MYDRVGLYRGKKSLCCVNNSKRHLTKRFMGNPRGHCPLCGPGIPEQCDSDENREPDHEQPPQGPQDRQKQKCAGDRRLRFR